AVVLAGEDNFDKIRSLGDEVFTLADEINALYESMDDSLQFKKAEKNVASKEIKAEQNAAEEQEEKRHFKDFRGVACPMNFVKTKIELSLMNSGELLEILLD
ncbi:sulfurtransferase TusA family protein, partial [archaeon]|nr:sulfurtransferase TusA family protein [archaeon]